MPHTLLIPNETRTRLVGYLGSLQNGSALAGIRLQAKLAGTQVEARTEAKLHNALLNTKVPQIFAERLP